LIGDSITGGYGPKVEEALKGKASVARLMTSKSIGDPVLLAEVALVLGQCRFDVVHVNNGLHGWGYSEEEYRQHFPELVATIRKHAAQAKLIWATTTPVRQAGNLNVMAEDAKRVEARNKIADGIVGREKIAVNDLLGLVKDHPEWWSADGVHFNAQGISAQAAQVAVAQRRAWLARGSGGLAVLGVNDPTKPTCLTGAWTTLAEDVALMGKHALVAGGDKGLLVYELQQHLYAPLAPPVMAGGRMTLSWPAMDEVRLQKTTRLSPADWQEGPQSEGTNGVFLPMTDPMAFFRLVQGDEFIPPDIPPD